MGFSPKSGGNFPGGQIPPEQQEDPFPYEFKPVSWEWRAIGQKTNPDGSTSYTGYNNWYSPELNTPYYLPDKPPQMWLVYYKGELYQSLIGTDQARAGYQNSQTGEEVTVPDPADPNIRKGWWVNKYDNVGSYQKYVSPKPFFLPASFPEEAAQPEQQPDQGSPFENSRVDQDPNKGVNWPGRDQGEPPSPVDPNSRNVPARITQPEGDPFDESSDPNSYVPDPWDPSPLQPGEQRARFDLGNGQTSERPPSDWEPENLGPPNPWDTPKPAPFDPYDPGQYTPERGNAPPRSAYYDPGESLYGPVRGPEWNPNLNNVNSPYYQLPGTQYNPSHPFLAPPGTQPLFYVPNKSGDTGDAIFPGGTLIRN